ncbi:hypothetical protein QTP88_014245 [Uroleucon formosanum]
MFASTSDTNRTLKHILDTVNELKSTQNKIISTINSCRESNKTEEKKYVIIESKLDTLSNQLAEVISENKTLRAKIKQIDDKITILETAASPGANVESLTDTHTVDEILKGIGLQINPVSVRRLGKQSNKPRPLLTTLPNSSDVFEVLKVKRKLFGTSNFKDICIASDRTTQQRQYFSKIVSQLKQRSDTGEDNLFIKYINNQTITSNIPSVISYNNQTVTGGDKIADCFANYYSTIYQQLNCMPTPPDNIKLMKVDLNTCIITLSDIYEDNNAERPPNRANAIIKNSNEN